MSKTKTQVQLLSALQGVRLEPHPGSSLRDPTNELIEIPAQSVIEIEGRASPSGLINVLWNGEAFSVLDEDLRSKGSVVAV